jgi:hypothetical protein
LVAGAAKSGSFGAIQAMKSSSNVKEGIAFGIVPSLRLFAYRS